MPEQRCWNCWTESPTVRSSLTDTVYCLFCGAARPGTGTAGGRERREAHAAGDADNKEEDEQGRA